LSRKKTPLRQYLSVYPQIVNRLRKFNLSADEIAFVLGVTTRTYWNWRARYPAFKRASKAERRGPRIKEKRNQFSN
jgi:hypothetical protein